LELGYRVHRANRNEALAREFEEFARRTVVVDDDHKEGDANDQG
jgi:hypothetical protein